MSGATLIIPLTAVPAQVVTATLSSQSCTLNIYQKATNVPSENGLIGAITPLFIDVYVNDALVIGGVLCLNAVKIVRDAYLGFIGDLVFYDTQGTDDPVYTGLGSRFVLTYWPALA